MKLIGINGLMIASVIAVCISDCEYVGSAYAEKLRIIPRETRQRLKEITEEKDIPAWFSPLLKVSLVPYTGDGYPWGLEFAADNSECLMAWWIKRNQCAGNFRQMYDECIGENIVIGFDGKIGHLTMSEGKKSGKELISLFPRLSYRYRQEWHDLLKKSESFGFSDDWQYGIRLNLPDAELLDMRQKKSLWKVRIGRVSGSGAKLTVFTEWKGTKAILMATTEEGDILSLSDGRLIGIVPYGEDDVVTDKDRYREKYRPFSALQLAFDPVKRILAVGDFNSRRVKIIKIDPPYRKITELNSEDDPFLPKGGKWIVEEMHFGGGGRYLIVNYRFGGRSAEKGYRPTEIYDTDTWKLCMRVNKTRDYLIRCVTVSPDGKKIAFVRVTDTDVTLEMGAFIPNCNQ